MYFSGRVHTIAFENVSKAFYIVRMVLDGASEFDTPVAVKGHIPGIQVKIGAWFGFEADWVKHKDFGMQLAITKAPVIKTTWTADEAAKVLTANGIGPSIVRQLRDHHGEEDFVSVLSDQAKLEATPGLDSFSALYVLQRWQKIQAYFRGLNFLLSLNLPPGLVKQVWSTFGDDVAAVLGKNPWAMTRIDGISFQQADEVALRLGLPMNSPDRLNGLIVAITKSHRSMGHLYLTTSQVMAEVSGVIPEATAKDLGASLVVCHKDGSIVLDRSVLPGTLAIYDPWSYKIESHSATALASRMKTAGFGSGGLDVTKYLQRLAKFGPETDAEAKKKRAKLDKVARVAVEEWGKSNKLALSDNQKMGTIRALTTPVSILTGLPGTGKTTSLRAVVNILQDAGVKFLLCAPTGIAAKNLSVLTGAPASTIHRAFSALGKSDEKRDASYMGVHGGSDSRSFSEQDETWGYGETSPYPAEVVIVDEASMLDQHLLFRLLDCTSPTTRLVIVGDAAQLPSVGPGNVLRDMIKSELFPVTDLREIFRQQDTSAIVYASHDIHRGEVPECEPPSDFSLVRTTSEDQALKVILALASKLYQKRENFQILSPRHAGPVGVTNLNIKLRDLLNPAQPGLREFQAGRDEVIREDDRIMVIRNDYDLKDPSDSRKPAHIFNGDVGKVVLIDSKAKEIEVKIFGNPVLNVRLPFKDVPTTIRLAYACTVHKAQGLEYEVIVMPLVDGFRHQLQRNLLYTAVTRAKKKVFLIGTHSAMRVAVMNDREDLRNTLLKERLKAALTGGSVSP